MDIAKRQPTETTRPSVFWPLAGIVLPITGLICRIRVGGTNNVPATGAYVIAPNHLSEFDPVTVAVAVWRAGRAPRFMAKESLFSVPVLGAALRATGMVPVARSHRAASAAIEQAQGLIDRDAGVIIYPEGTLTREPNLWPMRGKSGAVRLALAGDLPLIPMAHWGEQRVMPRYGRFRPWPPRKRVDLVFGEPVDLSDLRAGAHDQRAVTEGTERLMRAITELLEHLRGEPAPPDVFDPRDHVDARES